jgi:hypothetical protein
MEVFLFSEMFILSLVPIHPPIRWVSGFCPGVKQQGHDADLTSASGVEIRNEWSHSSAFPACVHVMDKENFAYLLERCFEQCVAVKTLVKNYL